MIVGFHDRLPSIILPSLQSPVVSLPSLTFTISVQLSSLTLTSVSTPLPYHLPLHPVTVTTSQPPRSALRCVPPHRQLLRIPLSSSSAENTLLVCLLNARSVGTSRRRCDISTFIQDNSIDIVLLTETWLRPAGDDAKIADLAPPGYSVLSFPRFWGSAKGGGIDFSLKPHVATTSSFPLQHSCPEAAHLTLTYNKHLTVFCIYRPLPSKNNKFSASFFFIRSCYAKES